MKFQSVVLRAALVACLGAAAVIGQTFTASILGTVTDASGAAVPHAQVTVTNVSTGTKQVVQTDDSGKYTTPYLAPGDYSVAVEATGFKRASQPAFTLQVDQRQNIDFRLEVGQASQSVEVTAEVTAVQTDTANVGAEMNRTQAAELPVNGRNIEALNVLIPGIAPEPPTAGGVNTEGGNGGGGFVAHGLLDSQNYFWLDGQDNTSQAVGQYIVAIPLYAVQETKVESPSYDTEFGRNPGAQVNTILKSGGNNLHGEVYFFLRNSVFDAKNFFSPPGAIPAYRRGQFGADLGGKLRKDKLFYFIEFEGQDYAQGTPSSVPVPTHQETLGNFNDQATVIRDPATCTTPGTLTTCTPFVGNIIPASRLTTVGLDYAAFYPLPNSGVNTASIAPVNTDSDNNYLAKLDWNISSNDRFSGFWDFEGYYSHQPVSSFSGNQLPPFGINIINAHDILTGISETHTFSPSLISYVRFGWNAGAFPYHAIEDTEDYCAAYGIQGCRSGSENWYPPVMSLNGTYASVGGGNDQYGPFDTTFFYPEITWVKGKHTIKFGGNYDHYYVNNKFQEGPGGGFTFRGTWSGNPLADMLLALPYSATYEAFQYNTALFQMTAQQYGAFAQDDIHVTQHLTMTVGMRYDYQVPITESRDREANYDFTNGIANPKLIFAGQNGWGGSTYTSDPNEFGPRFGFAWSPKSSWSVRGGYGVFFQTINWSSSINIRENPPFTTNYTVVGNGTTLTTNNAFVVGLVANPNPAITAFGQNLKYGHIMEYSVGVQHQLGHGLLIDANYVGNRGKDLDGSYNANTPYTTDPATQALAVQGRRPNQTYAGISLFVPLNESQYDGLELSVQKRLSAGSTFLASYTYSKADGDTTTQDPHNVLGGWGPIGGDIRQHLAFSYVYQLPVGKGRAFLANLSGPADWILGGWAVNGILQLHSGLPFTATNGQDNLNNLVSGDSGWPNVIGNPYQSSTTCQTGTPQCWVNSAAFAQCSISATPGTAACPTGAPAKYTFGNEPEGFLRGPGFANLDLSLSKNFAISENKKVQFRAQAYNLTNRVNFYNPASALTATFGQITKAQASRELEFTVRFAW